MHFKEGNLEKEKSHCACSVLILGLSRGNIVEIRNCWSWIIQADVLVLPSFLPILFCILYLPIHCFKATVTPEKESKLFISLWKNGGKWKTLKRFFFPAFDPCRIESWVIFYLCSIKIRFSFNMKQIFWKVYNKAAATVFKYFILYVKIWRVEILCVCIIFLILKMKFSFTTHVFLFKKFLKVIFKVVE